MRWRLLIAGLVAVVGCDSNPTPHPGRGSADATYNDTAHGGGGDTQGLVSDTSSVPSDMSDAMSPTAGDEGDAAVDGDGVDAGDAGDAGDVDAGPDAPSQD